MREINHSNVKSNINKYLPSLHSTFSFDNVPRRNVFNQIIEKSSLSYKEFSTLHQRRDLFTVIADAPVQLAKDVFDTLKNEQNFPKHPANKQESYPPKNDPFPPKHDPFPSKQDPRFDSYPPKHEPFPPPHRPPLSQVFPSQGNHQGPILTSVPPPDDALLDEMLLEDFEFIDAPRKPPLSSPLPSSPPLSCLPPPSLPANWADSSRPTPAPAVPLQKLDQLFPSHHLPFLPPAQFPIWPPNPKYSLLHRPFSLPPSPPSSLSWPSLPPHNSDWSSNSFPWSPLVNQANTLLFQNSSLRSHQRLAINAILAKRDVFVLIPTGGGKSLSYQLTALLQPGLTIVVFPLLSLLHDQEDQMKENGLQVVSLSSSLPLPQQKSALLSLENDPVDILLCTPEKLRHSQALLNTLRRLHSSQQISRFVIDEAHCVSQWGEQFRPDYLKLSCLRQEFPEVPILALTATATLRVVRDVSFCLGLQDPVLVHSSFDRPNLRYEVRVKSRILQQTVRMVSGEVREKFRGQSGIVYCLSRRECEEVSRMLIEEGVESSFYHASMDLEERERTRKEWMSGKLQIIVATIAFGMGINKKNCRFVIHISLPKSIENYYQESGRAGRDGLASTCIVYFSWHDSLRLKQLSISAAGGEGGEERGGERGDRGEEERKIHQILECFLDGRQCRRAMMLKHFGESAPKQCGFSMETRCDNCSKRERPLMKNATQEAILVMELVRGYEDRYVGGRGGGGRGWGGEDRRGGSKVTISILRDAVLGVSTSKTKKGFAGEIHNKLSSLPQYGRLKGMASSGWNVNTVQALIQTMVIRGILMESPLQTNSSMLMGFVSLNRRIENSPYCVNGRIVDFPLEVDLEIAVTGKNSKRRAGEREGEETEKKKPPRKNNSKKKEDPPPQQQEEDWEIYEWNG